jgi:Zn-dependent peptidase ImmA (M78 family)/DNA-binding XRE family transcriptional regulator
MRIESPFYGGRLRLARNFLGLSQTELADAVEVSRTFIYKVEREEAAPSEQLRAALAEELGFPVEFFFRPLVDELAEEQAHFRKRVTTPQHVKHQAAALGTLFAEAIDYLDELLSLPEVRFPSIRCASVEDIERAAEECRRQWGLGLDAPISNMIRVLENAGAVVATFEGSSQKVDAFSWSRRRPIVVRSTLKKSPTRARWDYAHECGHLVMHEGSSLEEHEAEAQANRFAGAFLLPRAGFLREFPRSYRLNWRTMFQLKDRWGVSLQAMIRRAFDLQLIDARQYRSASIFVAKKGWKKSEPGEPEETEVPELVSLALQHLEQRHSVHPYHVAQNLCWTPTILERVLGVAAPNSPTPNVIPIRTRRAL